MLAGGIGSALSDLIGGYFVYVPITLVIKGLVALVSGLIYQKMCRYGKNRYVAVILGGITDIVFVAGGYFICEFFLYGSGAAEVSLLILSRESADLLSLLYYIRY